MRKLLPILLLAVLFMSCSSDDNSDDGSKDKKNMIDEKILGKWKVEYSKTIKGAKFLEDGTLEIAENATVTEYMGNYDAESSAVQDDIKSGLFDLTEYKIEINKNNSITVYPQYKIESKTIYYIIENGLLVWVDNLPKSTGSLSQDHKYKLEKNRLIIERIPNRNNSYTYTISEYSKISE